MKRICSHSNLTKKVLATLLCTGVLSVGGGISVEAVPTPPADSMSGEWYVYTTDPNADIVGQSGDHIQLGDGTAVTISANAVYGGKAAGDAAVSGSAVVVKPNVTLPVNGEGEPACLIIGGVTETGTATGNSVTMEGGKASSAYGSYSAGGTATDGTVEVSGGEVADNAFGSYSANSNASGGTVTITGGTVGNMVIGTQSEGGTATGGTVTVSGNNTVVGTVFGAGGVGNASDGQVTINGGTVSSGVIHGTNSIGGTATGGTVTINGGTVGSETATGNVFGAISSSKTATDGVVTITGGKIYCYAVTGSGSTDGDAKDGTVTLSNGTVNGNIFGSASPHGNATGGKVEVSSGEVTKDVYGSYSLLNNASNGTATITGGTVHAIVGGTYGKVTAENGKADIRGGKASSAYGSYSDDGTATDGTVEVSGGEVTNNAYGSYSKNSNASGGTVTITDGTVGNMVIGTQSEGGTATGGTVTVSGNNTVVDAVFGAGGVGNASDGQVTINGGTVSSGVIHGTKSIGGTATGGTVTINGGTVGSETASGNVFGAMSSSKTATDGVVTITGGKIYCYAVTGSGSTDGDAKDGTVTLSNGTVNGNIYGSASSHGNATGGVVNLEGGSVTGKVVGGYIFMSSGKNATNNTVNLKASYPDAEIYGGDGSNTAGDLVTGNTLNVHGRNLQVKKIANFQDLNFYLPSNIQNNEVVLNSKVDVAKGGTTVNAYVSGSSNLDKGDTVYLTKGAVDASKGTVKKGTLSVGISRNYAINLETKTDNIENDYIRLRIGEDTSSGSGSGTDQSGLTDQTKSLVETPVFTAGLIADGADMLVNTTLHDAEALTLNSDKEWTVFASMAYNDMRYNTGSHVDFDGWNANLGFARRFKNGSGELLVGPFFEYGKGDYDSYSEGIHAEGDGHFTGGGIFAKQKNNDGFYYEGSVRGGRVSADYSTDDMVTSTGKKHVSYDYDASYYAFHVGLGKVYDLQNGSNIDAYLRYLYSHQNSFDATLSTNEDYDFDSVTSSKIRTGLRWTKAANEQNKFYAGLAYQYEFDNEATAHYDGDSTLSPDLKGSSGMAELGWLVKPGKDSNMAIDLAVTGWVGKKRGVNFRAGAQWFF